MLESTDQRVCDFHSTLKSRRRKANHEQEIVDSMASGMTWPKCFGKHQEAKRFLKDKLNRTVALQKVHSHKQTKQRRSGSYDCFSLNCLPAGQGSRAQGAV